MHSSKDMSQEIMPLKVIIRHAREDDLQAIIKLSEKLGKDESTADSMVSPEPSEFQNPKWILKNIKGQNTVVFVAELDGEVIGYSLGWISQPWSYKGKRGYICDCFVDEPYREKGIGKALVRAMLDWFTKRGADCVEADVYSGNIPSLAMFEGLGFKEVSKRLRFIIKRGDSH